MQNAFLGGFVQSLDSLGYTLLSFFQFSSLNLYSGSLDVGARFRFYAPIAQASLPRRANGLESGLGVCQP